MINIISTVPGFVNFISNLQEGDEREFQFLHPKSSRELTDFTNAVRQLSAGRLMEIKAIKGYHNKYRVTITITITNV